MLLRVIRFALYGDFHVCTKWEPDGDRIRTYEFSDDSGLPTEIHQPMKCVKCGRRKSFKL